MLMMVTSHQAAKIQLTRHPRKGADEYWTLHISLQNLAASSDDGVPEIPYNCSM